MVLGIGLEDPAAKLKLFRLDVIKLRDIPADIGAPQKILNEAGWK